MGVELRGWNGHLLKPWVFWLTWLQLPFRKHLVIADADHVVFLTRHGHPVGLAVADSTLKAFKQAGLRAISEIAAPGTNTPQ